MPLLALSWRPWFLISDSFASFASFAVRLFLSFVSFAAFAVKLLFSFASFAALAVRP
jgi:hypothetical protein